LWPTSALAFNSEEHKVLTDLGTAKVVIDTSIVLPLSLGMVSMTKDEDRAAYAAAKLLAVGFASNDLADYSEDVKKVQDHSYWTGYAQRGSVDGPPEGNLWLWIPPDDFLVTQRLQIPADDTWPGATFSLGQLVALYGDFRKTTFCDEGVCYLTNADTETVKFDQGWDWFGFPTNNGWRPDPVNAAVYLQAIGSGLWPPYGSAGNATSNTAGDTDYFEAGWWGDELLRIAAVNDWHFATAALAWYVGMHRLALHYVALAVDNPDYWVAALHYEANALHSFTDLFAFGHVVTHRGPSSWGVVQEEDSGYQNTQTWQWMQHVLVLGGAQRVDYECPGLLSYTCRRVEYPAGAIQLPAITEPAHGRDDFLPTYAPGAWANWSLTEKRYHSAFNDAGACVRNLRGDAFRIRGDGHLRSMTDANGDEDTSLCGAPTVPGLTVITDGVTLSVQSLFDAYAALAAGETTLDALTAPGSASFAALHTLPLYVISNTEAASTSLAGITFDYGAGHFTGRWVNYAGAIQDIAGAEVLPPDWASCRIPFIDGGHDLPPQNQDSCQPFPVLQNADAPEVVETSEVVETPEVVEAPEAVETVETVEPVVDAKGPEPGPEPAAEEPADVLVDILPPTDLVTLVDTVTQTPPTGTSEGCRTSHPAAPQPVVVLLALVCVMRWKRRRERSA